MSGRVAWAIGLAAGVAGGLGWMLALLFAPSANGSSGLGPRTIVFLAVMLLSIGGVAAGVFLHAMRGTPGALAMTWFAAVLLVFGTIISGFTVGVFFLPAAILALAACVAASICRPIARAA